MRNGGISMGLLNYRKAVSKYQDNPSVMETLRRLRDFDEFHCLRDSSLMVGKEAGALLPRPNPAYIGWMSVCEGGLLFDTTLLCVQAEDPDLGVSFSTLAEYNTPEGYQEFGLPDGYFIIGIRSYGDPICLSGQDDAVYLWDCEESAFTTIWDTFFDFLGDEVDSAIELIANGDLEPVPLKLQDSEDTP
jgi:hypothetical protein